MSFSATWIFFSRELYLPVEIAAEHAAPFRSGGCLYTGKALDATPPSEQPTPPFNSGSTVPPYKPMACFRHAPEGGQLDKPNRSVLAPVLSIIITFIYKYNSHLNRFLFYSNWKTKQSTATKEKKQQQQKIGNECGVCGGSGGPLRR